MSINQLLLILFLASLFSNEISTNQHFEKKTIHTNKEKNSLKILSWNIKMLPSPYGWIHNRVERAENIIMALQSSGTYDVILFQEAFSSSMRNKI